MRTLLNNIKHIDNYLSGNLSQEDLLVFEAKLVIDPSLRWQVSLQKKVMNVIKLYGRKKTRSEAVAIGHKLFQDPSKEDFRDSVRRAFENK